MKNLLCIFCFLGLYIGASAQKSGTQSTTIQTSIACSHCLQCETCKYSLDAALFKIKGVKNVTIDPQAQTIAVSYNPSKTNLQLIKDTINATGYDADEQKASAEAIDRLDGCCKKPE